MQYLKEKWNYFANYFVAKVVENKDRRVTKYEIYCEQVYKILSWEDNGNTLWTFLVCNFLFWAIVFFEIRPFGMLFSAMLILFICDSYFETRNYVSYNLQHGEAIDDIYNYFQEFQTNLLMLKKESPSTFSLGAFLFFLFLSVLTNRIPTYLLIYIFLLEIFFIPLLFKILPDEYYNAFKGILKSICNIKGVLAEEELIPFISSKDFSTQDIDLDSLLGDKTAARMDRNSRGFRMLAALNSQQRKKSSNLKSNHNKRRFKREDDEDYIPSDEDTSVKSMNNNSEGAINSIAMEDMDTLLVVPPVPNVPPTTLLVDMYITKNLDAENSTKKDSATNSIASGISIMPSYLDVAENQDDIEEEDLIPNRLGSSQAPISNDFSSDSESEHRDMKFDSAHFNSDSSSDEEKLLSKGLSFTDYRESSAANIRSPESNISGMLTNLAVMGSSLLNVALSSNTKSTEKEPSSSDSEFEIVNSEDIRE